MFTRVILNFMSNNLSLTWYVFFTRIPYFLLTNSVTPFLTYFFLLSIILKSLLQKCPLLPHLISQTPRILSFLNFLYCLSLSSFSDYNNVLKQIAWFSLLFIIFTVFFMLSLWLWRFL